MRTHETVWSFKQGFNHDINTNNVLRERIDFDIQDWPDFRVRTNPPSWVGMFSDFDVLCNSRHAVCITSDPSSIRNEDIVLSQFPSRNQRRSKVSTISDHQKVRANFLENNLAPRVPCADNVWAQRGVSNCESQSISPKIHKSHLQYDFVNLDLILCINLRLLRRYRADWQKKTVRKNQLNGFFHYRWSEWTYFPLPSFFFCEFSSVKSAGGTKHRTSALSQSWASCLQQILSHSPSGLWRWVPYHFSSDPGTRNDQRPCGNLRAYSVILRAFAIQCSLFPRFVQSLSLYIDMKMILPLNCSGSPSFESRWDLPMWWILGIFFKLELHWLLRRSDPKSLR